MARDASNQLEEAFRIRRFTTLLEEGSCAVLLSCGSPCHFEFLGFVSGDLLSLHSSLLRFGVKLRLAIMRKPGSPLDHLLERGWHRTLQPAPVSRVDSGHLHMWMGPMRGKGNAHDFAQNMKDKPTHFCRHGSRSVSKDKKEETGEDISTHTHTRKRMGSVVCEL